MKYVLREVHGILDTNVFTVELYNEELEIWIELRLKDHFCRDFKRTYDPFFNWLRDMINVPMEPDCIITAFEKFKNADALYKRGAEDSCASD